MRPLLRYYLMSAAMLALLLFLNSMWLPQGSPQSCAMPWRPCLSVYSQNHEAALNADAGHELVGKPDDVAHGNSDTVIDSDDKDILIEECPGQNFQVSRLLAHLNSALASPSDVLLQPYLSSWDELIKYMESLGPLVSFFTHKVQEKLTVIRQLAQQEAEKLANSRRGASPPSDTEILKGREPPLHFQITGSSISPELHAYHSVRLMLDAELQRGLVNFDRRTDSGSRTLLRLHRSLLWLQLLLEKLGEGPDETGRLRTPGELCREAYYQALAPYHPWLIQRAAELVFTAMPERSVFLHLVCVESQEEAAPVMGRVIKTIKEVHHRTQIALQEKGMLELP
ncbi:ceramide-1-phosphate transfer protein [Chanos chanos]|uniref:Ceramide-1-phosphate transfer protein n=1 Tax=Chanos chanos TaxID=29144 RepID=A0A6J2VIV9_CHACN|nr:ceramide-1-phosphate transfer protein-like [Chanos chanos]